MTPREHLEATRRALHIVHGLLTGLTLPVVFFNETQFALLLLVAGQLALGLRTALSVPD